MLRGSFFNSATRRLASKRCGAGRARPVVARVRRPASLALAAALLLSACSLEPMDLEGERPLALRSTIRAADGSLLTRVYRENRAYIAYDQIPRAMIDAVISAEDSRFFSHGGFDLKAIGRALLANMDEGETIQGGSTITQQYVKNTYFRQAPKTLERKARELRIAIEVERQYSKKEILERYLNTVYFGHGAYGLKTAVETFFGHDVDRLGVHEAALLAALIKSPSLYDPSDHAKKARQRRNYVLDRMAELGHVELRAARRAKRAPLSVTPNPPPLTLRQPYFVEAVKREVLADKRLGRTEQGRARALYKGGLSVTTTLRPGMQRMASDAVESVLNQPGDPAAALIALDPQTGEILSMVGGSDFSTSQVNLALGRDGGGSGRQPGSTMKPIVAAAALETGLSFDETYESGPLSTVTPDGSTWTVGNTEGGGGAPLPINEALVDSVNGVFARLALDLGAGAIANQAELMGVSAPLPTVPSIALGSAEVSVLDMAAAYGTLANRGTAVEPTTIRSVETPDGRVIRPRQRVTPGVLAPGNAYLITKALEQVIERGTGTAARIGRPAAGKTGTTNDYGDAWFVGYTPDLVTAVWVGYPQGRIPMTNVHGIQVVGGSLPAQIWRNFMSSALAGRPKRQFLPPLSDTVEVRIDPASGLLAAPWCQSKVKRMLRQEVPTETCPQPPSPSPIPTETATPTPTPTPSPTPSAAAPKDKPATPSPSPSRSP
ncbi:MAG: transglycosylase domain-containing protein [Actinomycetota bacterium]